MQKARVGIGLIIVLLVIGGALYLIFSKNEKVIRVDEIDTKTSISDFTLPDAQGNPFRLSDIRAPLRIINFWASWCGPCRRENPNVVTLYNDFNDKGFEIIGVSFDEDGNKWVDAIKQDGLTWVHVSDLQGWGSAAGKLYGINSIPATVLLDRNGVIVRQTGGEIDAGLRAQLRRLEELLA